jgi:hypothetical protein
MYHPQYIIPFLRAQVAQWVRSLDLTAHTSLSPIWRGFVPSFVNCKKRCTRLAAASDKVYQLLANGRWFSTGTPASFTTKIGRHDIAQILLKVVLNTINKIKSLSNHPLSKNQNYFPLKLWYQDFVIMLLGKTERNVNVNLHP